MTNQQPVPASPPPFADLLARQAQLRAWIEQLGAGGDDVPAHVVDRVRGDYEKRLAEILEQLRSHEEVIREDADRLQDELQLAREEQERAHDELAEGRLRNRLGEWTTAEWELRRGELERVAAAASEREEKLRLEMEKLEELLFEITEPAEADTVPDEDYGFLEEIDRAIGDEDTIPEGGESTLAFEEGGTLGVRDEGTLSLGGSRPPPAPLPVPDAGTLPLGAEPRPVTRPKAGVKCRDCGYTNEPSAWYCGVCGVNLT